MGFNSNNNNITTQYRPFALVYLEDETHTIRSHFHNKKVCDLMRAGKTKEALKELSLTCPIKGYKEIGIEIITTECIYN